MEDKEDVEQVKDKEWKEPAGAMAELTEGGAKS